MRRYDIPRMIIREMDRNEHTPRPHTGMDSSSDDAWSHGFHPCRKHASSGLGMSVAVVANGTPTAIGCGHTTSALITAGSSAGAQAAVAVLMLMGGWHE